MSCIIISTALCLASTIDIVRYDGALSYYDQRPTDATLALRRDWGQVSDRDYAVYLAVVDCGLIGREATLITDDGVFSAVVFDCAGRSDGGREWMIANGIAAEVDFYFSREWPEAISRPATVVVYEN